MSCENKILALGRMLILSLNLVLFTNVSGQRGPKEVSSDSLSLEAISERVGTFLNEQIALANPVKTVNDTALLRLLFDSQYGETNQNLAFQQFYDAQARALRGDIGLNLVGNYTENFNPGVLENEDLSFYRRAYLGLDWNLLSGGWYTNYRKAKVLEKEKEIQMATMALQSKDANYLYLQNYITYVFKLEKLKKLNQRRTVLSEQLRTARQLYFLRYTTWEDVLDLQSKWLEVDAMRNNDKVYYDPMLKDAFPPVMLEESFVPNFLPILDIDPAKMIALFNKENESSPIKDLELEKFQLEHNKWQEWSVKPYFRYNFMVTPQKGDVTYSSLGLSVSVPIKSGSKRRDAEEAKRKILTNDEDMSTFGSGSELLNNYYEYQFKKTQFISFYFKKLKAEEKIRKEIVKRDLGLESFSPLHAIALMDEKISIEVELIDIKKDMYLKFLKIYSLLKSSNPNSFISVIHPEELVRRYQGDRYLYVWSDDFKSRPISETIAYLINSEISVVLLSVGSDIKGDDPRLDAFVSQCNANNIKIQLMIGTKEPKGDALISSITSKVELAARLGIQGIHLDVEPHTLPAYRGNQEAIMADYLPTLAYARGLVDSARLALTVSIPVNWEGDLLEQVYDLSDKVMLMAYEETNLTDLLRRISEELSTNSQKSVVALSASDFSDRLAFETFIQKLIREGKINAVALHDLGRLIQLDNRSVYKP
jgi:hypothetical protein